MISRRTFARLLPLGVAGGALTRSAQADEALTVETSDLIYLSPLKSDGGESRCQGEVWFQSHDDALYVVTGKEAWRAEAVRQGLTKARVWVGDVGVWTDSNGEYKALPQMDLSASLETDPAVHAAVLDKMGSKYSMAWLVWGPRFKNGLADGSRVMLKYS